MIKYLILLSTLLVTNILYATNYYIDATTGNDNNNGKTSAAAWQTITKVMSMSLSFQPGDSILFKKGEIWNGEGIISSNHPSGIVDNPITYTSYGSGTKPIINIHTQQYPTWTDVGNNIWSTEIGVGSRFFKNGIEMLRAANTSYLGLYGSEYHTELINGGNNFKLSIYSTINPVNNTYSWSSSTSVVKLYEADFINLIGIDFQGGASASIRIYDCIGWKVINCNAGRNAALGIKIKSSSDIFIDSSHFDANNTIDQSQLPDNIPGSSYSGCEDGVFVTTGSSNITIRNCMFKNWGHASFSSNTDDSSNIISNIIFYNNELTSPDILYGGRLAYSGYSESGEYYNNYIHNISVANQLGGSNNHFHHNIIDGVLNSPLKSDNIGIGIWMQNYNVQVRDNIIENNVIANTQGKGFEVFSINWDYPNEFTGNVFRNNIIYDCGTLDNDIAIQLHKDQSGQLIYNNIVENNLIYSSNTTQTCLYQYNGTLSNVTIFNTQDVDIQNNIGGNPLFVDAANGDYHLTGNSPAIDAGTPPVATEDFDGNTIPNGNTADIGAYEYSSATEIHENLLGEFDIFPNPTSGELFISSELLYQDYMVFSLTGSILKSEKVNANKIDLSNLKSGMYFIVITENESRNSRVAKLVIE